MNNTNLTNIHSNIILKITNKKRDDSLKIVEVGVIKENVSLIISKTEVEDSVVTKNVMSANSVSNISRNNDSDIHYIAILPVIDNIYMKDTPLFKTCTNWLYGISLLYSQNECIPIFPLDNIDEQFKYKSYIKKLMYQEWGLTKKSIYTIKHLVTTQNIHVYICVLNSKKEIANIKNSINYTKQDQYYWKDYLIPMSKTIDKPYERPYNIQFPIDIKNKYILKYNNPVYRNCENITSLDQIFNLISSIG